MNANKELKKANLRILISCKRKGKQPLSLQLDWQEPVDTAMETYEHFLAGIQEMVKERGLMGGEETAE